MRTNPKSTQSTPFWTAREVKPLFGYRSTSSFWTFVHNSGLPYVKLNARRILFSPAAIEDWLQNRAVGTHAGKLLPGQPETQEGEQ